MSLFAADPAAMARLRTRSATATARAGRSPTSRPGEVYLDRDAAAALGARAGDRAARPRRRPRRHGSASRRSSTTTAPAPTAPPCCCRSRARRRCSAARARSATLLVSNRGDATVGAAHTDRRARRGRVRRSRRSGLELQDVKRDGLELADEQGDVFVSVFTTFGSFSIVAGILLIFLIFVMLSAERRAELGIARAIGTRREHLVQMFVFEGLAYDLGAAARRRRARRRRRVRDGLRAGSDAFSTRGWRSSTPSRSRSLVVAYALGVLLTFVVVAAVGLAREPC